MDKEKAKEHISKYLEMNDSLIGFFFATQPFKMWLFFLIGPLAFLSMRYYFIAVSEQGLYFFRLNFWGKFLPADFFAYNEIASVKIGKGFTQRPMKFTFENNRKLAIKAQLKGLEKVAKLTHETQSYLESHVQVVK
ncbi:MAG: hypothetical protein FIA97_12435 [Methylococcaceae bacterium]|nr:hypothetical protein [Methylococcaceae bacterium]